MKQGSLRRRSKLEIAESKRLEAVKKVEIEEKLAAFDRMQAQLDSLQEQAAAANQVHGVIQHLVDGGLIKELAPGQYEGVGSFQE